jgi:hypothetical protein
MRVRGGWGRDGSEKSAQVLPPIVPPDPKSRPGKEKELTFEVMDIHRELSEVRGWWP